MDDYFASDPIRDLDFSTRSVRSGSDRTSFGEHGEAMFLTSSFVFRNAAEAAARFGIKSPAMFIRDSRIRRFVSLNAGLRVSKRARHALPQHRVCRRS